MKNEVTEPKESLTLPERPLTADGWTGCLPSHLYNRHVFHTWGINFGTLLCWLSRSPVISADASPCAHLRPGEGKRTGERLMVVFAVRQITPDSACRGVGRARSSLCTSDASQGRAEEVNRSFTRCKLRATFGDNPRTIEPMWPRVLCTTWSMHQPHLGKTHIDMGVICITQVSGPHSNTHRQARTRTCAHVGMLEQRQTHAWMHTHARVNEKLSAHMVLCQKYVCAFLCDPLCLSLLNVFDSESLITREYAVYCDKILLYRSWGVQCYANWNENISLKQISNSSFLLKAR